MRPRLCGDEPAVAREVGPHEVHVLPGPGVG